MCTFSEWITAIDDNSIPKAHMSSTCMHDSSLLCCNVAPLRVVHITLVTAVHLTSVLSDCYLKPSLVLC